MAKLQKKKTKTRPHLKFLNNIKTTDKAVKRFNNKRDILTQLITDYRNLEMKIWQLSITPEIEQLVEKAIVGNPHYIEKIIIEYNSSFINANRDYKKKHISTITEYVIYMERFLTNAKVNFDKIKDALYDEYVKLLKSKRSILYIYELTFPLDRLTPAATFTDLISVMYPSAHFIEQLYGYTLMDIHTAIYNENRLGKNRDILVKECTYIELVKYVTDICKNYLNRTITKK